MSRVDLLVDPDAEVDPGVVGDPASRWRAVAGGVVTGLAVLFVLFFLVAPSEVERFTPTAFLRVPVEALVAVGLVLVLPTPARRWAVLGIGVVLGLLAVVKIVDMGFYAALDRSFDPVLDWFFLEAAVVFATQSYGRGGATVALVAAGALAVAVPVVMTLAVRRLTRVVLDHRRAAVRSVAALTVVWVAAAAFGVRVGPAAPVAAHVSYDRVAQLRAGLADQAAFETQLAVDAFRDAPAGELLTALRGKDVVFAFVESYGRVAVEHPELAPGIGAVLDAGSQRLRERGFAARSAYLTSPTAGGGSWLARATLLSGLWIDNQRRYRTLVASDRLTLNGAFRRAGWRTVGVMPGVILDWPEGPFFGNDRIYAADDLGYRGPRYSFATMPDQYTLSAFQRRERGEDRPPVMAEIPLVSSHAPWSPIPTLVDWNTVGDGSVFQAAAGSDEAPSVVWQRDFTRVRADYRRSIEYSLSTLVSYVETYGDDDLVLVFLGDHQPAPVVTGDDPNRDAPITIVTGDPALLDRIDRWGWDTGLRPASTAPVWPMDAFRDRFLATFSGR